jgi:hypothetical protein
MFGPRSLTILTAALLIMAFYLSLAPGYPNGLSDLDPRDRFVRGDLPATAYLNDLGVADVNDDGWLDVYSTNHDVRPLILINEEGSAWADRVLELNLSTNRVLIGADKVLGQGPPQIDAAGTYIYWTLNEFIVQTHQLPESRAAAGVILAGSAEIATTEGAVALAEHAAEGEIVAAFPADLVEHQMKAFHFTSRPMVTAPSVSTLSPDTMSPGCTSATRRHFRRFSSEASVPIRKAERLRSGPKIGTRCSGSI